MVIDFVDCKCLDSPSHRSGDFVGLVMVLKSFSEFHLDLHTDLDMGFEDVKLLEIK